MREIKKRTTHQLVNKVFLSGGRIKEVEMDTEKKKKERPQRKSLMINPKKKGSRELRQSTKVRKQIKE